MDACKAFEELYYVHPTLNSKGSVFSSMLLIHMYVRLACFLLIFTFLLLLHIYTHTHYTNTLQHYPKIRMQIESHSSTQLYFFFCSFSRHAGNSVTGKWTAWPQRREISSRLHCLCLLNSYATSGYLEGGRLSSRSMKTWSRNTALTS